MKVFAIYECIQVLQIIGVLLFIHILIKGGAMPQRGMIGVLSPLRYESDKVERPAIQLPL